jgi:hypothetical protein
MNRNDNVETIELVPTTSIITPTNFALQGRKEPIISVCTKTKKADK